MCVITLPKPRGVLQYRIGHIGSGAYAGIHSLKTFFPERFFVSGGVVKL